MPGVIVVRTRGNVPSSGTIANAGVASAVTAAHDTTGAGRAYYISPTGSDTTGSGSFSSPWATIGKFVASSRQPGDTLYCRGGTYTDAPVANIGLAVPITGTAANPITIRNYPGEVPHFVGATGAYKQFLFISWGTSYLVVDGLKGSNYNCTEASLCDIGETAGRTALVHHITIRNCTFTGMATGSMNDHGIYVSEYASDITLEDNIVIGPYPAQAAALTGGGIHTWHEPPTPNLIARRNILKGWQWGVMIGNSGTTSTGQILHNTFISNYKHVSLWRHGAFTIRDNAGDTPVSNIALEDPNNPANTTADHNFWGPADPQTFNPDYSLAPGSTGIDAASDGTDAGALDGSPASAEGHADAGTATATGAAYGAVFSAASTYEAVCLVDSPSFLLPMDESSGTLTDIVGSLTTTAYGTPTYGVTGPVTGHTGIQFDASGDYFTIADNDALDLGDGPFTIEWFMARDTDTGSWQFMFAKGSNGYGVGIDSTDLLSMVKSGVAQLAVHSGTTVPADSNWHYYAVTRSATRGAGSTILYIDGSAVETEEPSSSTELANTTSVLTIGSESTTSNPARSRIAYIGFYKSVLSASRISAHYSARTLG